jgi:anti-anti-sigma factor
MIEYSQDSEKLTCHFEGRLDTTKCLEIEKELLDKICGNSAGVVFNLERVAYVASSFLRLCLKAAKEKGAQQFRLTGVSPEIKKVFKIAGFDSVMEIN